MLREELVETGIVIGKSENKLKIEILETGTCEDCSAKIFCSPSENKRILEIDYNGNISEGDKVKVLINGLNLVKVSLILYGIPIILLLTGIMTSMYFYNTSGNAELYSFITGICLVSAYYFAVKIVFSGKLQNRITPEVMRNF